MLTKRNTSIWGIAIGLSFFLSISANLNAADTTSQLITHIDEILQANPMKVGEKVQMIPVAQDDTIALFVVRVIEGFAIKSHFHKTHDETDYVIKGTGQMLINDKWVDIKPGSLHFNPMGKVHTERSTGNEPLVFIEILTPGMKERDINFVE